MIAHVEPTAPEAEPPCVFTNEPETQYVLLQYDEPPPPNNNNHINKKFIKENNLKQQLIKKSLISEFY